MSRGRITTLPVVVKVTSPWPKKPRTNAVAPPATKKRIVGTVKIDGFVHGVVDWDLSNDGMLLIELLDGREIFDKAVNLDFKSCSGGAHDSRRPGPGGSLAT